MQSHICSQVSCVTSILSSGVEGCARCSEPPLSTLCFSTQQSGTLTSVYTVGNELPPTPLLKPPSILNHFHQVNRVSLNLSIDISIKHNGRIQEIRYRKDPGAAYVHFTLREGDDCTAYHPLVSGNHNQQQQHQNQNNQNQGYGGQQSDNIPGGYGGQQQQSYGQNQGGDFGVTGGAQYNAPHGSGGAGSAGGGGIGSLLGMMNRMSSLSPSCHVK